MNKLRVTFKKGESTRYISHLDVLRTFIRGLRRSNCPIKYSEGFNPHAVLTFALPLGVGVTSNCEIADISLTEDIDINKFIETFNNNMAPDSLHIIKGEMTEEKAPDIVKAEYYIEILNEIPFNKEDISNALKTKEILIDKKSKKTVKQINIMEHVFESEIIECENNHLKLRMIISAGNTFNVKPFLVIEGLESICENLKPIYVKPHREKFIFSK